jgi:hypothetical protein
MIFRLSAARLIAPSLRLFVSNSLTVYQRSFSSEGSARDILCLGNFSFRGANHYYSSLLMCARPEWHPDTVRSIPSALLFFFLYLSLSIVGGHFFYITGSRSTRRFFLRFGGGRPLRNVQHFILRIATVDLAIRLPISSLVVLLKVVSRFPLISSRSFFRSRFLRYRGRPHLLDPSLSLGPGPLISYNGPL